MKLSFLWHVLHIINCWSRFTYTAINDRITVHLEYNHVLFTIRGSQCIINFLIYVISIILNLQIPSKLVITKILFYREREPNLDQFHLYHFYQTTKADSRFFFFTTFKFSYVFCQFFSHVLQCLFFHIKWHSWFLSRIFRNQYLRWLLIKYIHIKTCSTMAFVQILHLFWVL